MWVNEVEVACPPRAKASHTRGVPARTAASRAAVTMVTTSRDAKPRDVTQVAFHGVGNEERVDDGFLGGLDHCVRRRLCAYCLDAGE